MTENQQLVDQVAQAAAVNALSVDMDITSFLTLAVKLDAAVRT